MTDFLSNECDRKIVEHWWLGLGCNVGVFFVRVANGDPSGWLFGIGMIGGAFIGVKFFTWWTEKKMAKEMEAFGF